jgi:cytochrome P450
MAINQRGVRYDQLDPSLRALREASPIRYDEQFHMWQVFRYDDVQRILSDPSTFSSNQGNLAGELIAASLISMDPPQHRRLRSLASEAFTPRRVQQLEAHITELAKDLLDAVVDRGHMDIITDFAYPLPTIVIAELLGVPTEDRDQFKHWSDTIVREIGLPPTEPRSNAQTEFIDYLYQQIDQRRQAPRNDLLSAFIAAETDGEKLSNSDIAITSALLLIGGHETTTNLIGNAFLCFFEHPEALEELRADRTLIPNAIEEVLRYWSPLVCTFRLALKDTQINGQSIKAGEYVQVFFPAANRDEVMFPDSNRFDIHRTPNRHVAFGYGAHYCLGAPLARLEGAIALRVILERFSSIQYAPEALFEPLDSMITQGVKHLPITFTVAR